MGVGVWGWGKNIACWTTVCRWLQGTLGTGTSCKYVWVWVCGDGARTLLPKEWQVCWWIQLTFDWTSMISCKYVRWQVGESKKDVYMQKKHEWMKNSGTRTKNCVCKLGKGMERMYFLYNSEIVKNWTIHYSCGYMLIFQYYSSKFLRPAMWVSYYSAPLWLLQVAVPLRVLWGNSAATAQLSVTVASEYPHSTYNNTMTCRNHSGTAYAVAAEYPHSTLCGTTTYETYVAVQRNLDVYFIAE